MATSGDEGKSLNVAPVSVDILSAIYLNVGFNLKLGAFGVGLHVASQGFDDRIDWTDEQGVVQEVEVTWQQADVGLGMAYAFLEGEFIVGAALDSVQLQVLSDSLADDSFDVITAAVTGGVLYAPHGEPWRLGAKFRSAALGDSTVTGDASQFGLYLEPTRVVAPWQLGFGGSWRWGEQPYNPRYAFDEDSSTDSELGDLYLLVAGDLILTGPTANAIGIESFLAQQYRRAGRQPTLGVRLGAESEVISNRLRLRAGSYWEPSRYKRTVGRLHGTAGAEVRVNWGWDWRIDFALDVADGYLNYGFGVGFWH